jgi:hypothetical protein
MVILGVIGLILLAIPLGIVLILALSGRKDRDD